MINILCIASTILSLVACSNRTILVEQPFKNLFTISDAEKILGEPAHLEDSTASTSDKGYTISLAYKANALDTKTEKTGIIYILAERYTELSAAQARYTFIKKANEHNGIITLDGIADEAYFHSDNQNFYFIMARKGDRVLTMKVNKITSNTSREEFDKIGKKIVEGL